MSPIIDQQKQLAESGQLRLGALEWNENAGREIPVKLKNWRLTSPDRTKIESAAEVYGGDVEEWERQNRPNEWQVLTETDELEVVLVPGANLSQWLEMWQGSECIKRCDGRVEHLSDTPCSCPPIDEREGERTDYCLPTTRLSVILPRLGTIGSWRLTTRGYYASVELAAAAEVIEAIADRGRLTPARLRIETRRARRDGTTMAYPVPVLDVDISLAALSSGEATLGWTPIEGHGGSTVAGALHAAREVPPKAPRSNAAAPIGRRSQAPAEVVDAPEAPQEAGGEGDPGPSQPSPADEISDEQRKRLWAIANEVGASEQDVRNILVVHTGQESSRMPRELYDGVVAAIQGVGSKGDSGAAANPPEPGAPPPSTDPGALVLEFGQHEGMTLGEIAKGDMGYIRFLANNFQPRGANEAAGNAAKAAAQAILEAK